MQRVGWGWAGTPRSRGDLRGPECVTVDLMDLYGRVFSRRPTSSMYVGADELGGGEGGGTAELL